MENDNNATIENSLIRIWEEFDLKDAIKNAIKDKVKENLENTPGGDILSDEHADMAVDYIFGDDNNLTYDNKNLSLEDFMKETLKEHFNDSAKNGMDELGIDFLPDNWLEKGAENLANQTLDAIKEVWNDLSDKIDELTSKQDQLYNNWDKLTPEQKAESIKNGYGPESFQRSTSANSSILNYNSQQAQRIIRRYDPLALDLNHNGKIDTTNANTSSAFFDMDNNGMSEITGWIDKEDGLLVYDKNNNGKIDNINELFGNENKDGYRELRELINSNGDNVIDKNDTKFKDLKIWQDLNGDGISQSNELKTLDELNITSINLNSKNTNIDDNGNNIFKTSTFTQNGQEYLSGDVNFAVDKRFTDFRGDYSLSVDALFLPWLRGYGDVKDAHIAYSMDEEFKEFTKTLVNDEQKAYNEFDTYLKKWSGLDKVHSANGITRDTLTMDDKAYYSVNQDRFIGYKKNSINYEIY